MSQENAVAGEFLGVAAGDEIDQKPAITDAVERGGLAREMGRRTKRGPKRREKTQPLGMRGQRRRCDPRFVTMRADRNQHAAIAEPVGGLRDLFQIMKIRRPMTLVAAKIRAVPADGNEPENIERLIL